VDQLLCGRLLYDEKTLKVETEESKLPCEAVNKLVAGSIINDFISCSNQLSRELLHVTSRYTLRYVTLFGDSFVCSVSKSVWSAWRCMVESRDR